MARNSLSCATPRWRELLVYERALWRRGLRFVCGVDEVGLGPLAGPVVAAAVVLPEGIDDALMHLNDSKKVTPKRRLVLAEQIRQHAVGWAVAAVDEAEIDATNIYQAARMAATRAVTRLVATLEQPIDHLLLDAHALPNIAVPQEAIVGGDGKSQSIAAASILAKVARDRYMTRLSSEYPGYGLERHMGYPTAAHLSALSRLGPSPVHRRSFGPVARLIAKQAPKAGEDQREGSNAKAQSGNPAPWRPSIPLIDSVAGADG